MPGDETVSNARSVSGRGSPSVKGPNGDEWKSNAPVVDSTSTDEGVEGVVLSPQLESGETTNGIDLGVVRLAPCASGLDVVGNERVTLLLGLPESLSVPAVIDCE